MALIKCPECGREISDKSKICIHCGYPLENEKDKKELCVKCPECENEIENKVKKCPYCGYPIGKKLYIQNTIQGISFPEKPFSTGSFLNKNSRIIVAISIFLIIVLGVMFFFLQGKKQASGEKIDEKSQSVSDSLDIGLQSEKSAIESMVNDFFAKLQKGNWEGTQEYLTEKYSYLESNPFGLSTESNIKKLFEHYNYILIDSKVNDERDTAFVNIEISHPNQIELLEASIANFSFNDGNSIENGFMNKLEDSDIGNMVTSGSLNLVKVDGQWKINVDDLFASCIFYGLSEETSFEKMAENQKKQAEEDLYIKEMIDLVDYRVGIMEGYSGKVPGINNISIKNNGDKQIDSLTLGIDFLDENGNVSLSKQITILGVFDNPISAGYSWKMEKDKFFEIENVPDNIDLNRVVVSINEAQLSNVDTSIHRTPEEEYIDQYIEVTNYNVGMHTGYRGKEPGISDVSIKNIGDKNISELTLTVYFQDENGKNIAEDSFMFIGGYGGGDTLKANYSWKMESNRYYEFKNLADEVDISRNNVKVTEIKFE